MTGAAEQQRINGITVEELSVTFRLPEGDVCAVDSVSTHFPEGKITGLIGESGCGKSVLGLAFWGCFRPMRLWQEKCIWMEAP